MKRQFAIPALMMLCATSFNISAKYHEPYDGSRIFWDINSRKTLFSAGNYARIIQLQDGRLMAAAESGGGISVCYSNDVGDNWSTPERIIQNAAGVPYAVPDLIQLSDGTILVGFNPRPSAPYSDERRFGIRTMRSTDNGKTWEGPIFIYDAQSTFADGCWEPSFLELPSGEIHCYFANENNFTTSNEQEISLCRSFDGGLTWGEASRVCFRAGSRDGMPSAILTDAGEIVVIVEDNGHPGYGGFRATTMRCTLEDNWATWVDATSPNRNMIFADAYDKGFISAAPYLRQLKSGETIASWQGDHGDRAGRGENYFDMFVAVGDADARNFKSVTEPFALSLSQHALWNSVAVAGDGSVFALASIGDDVNGNAINVMKGYPMRGFEANFGTPEIDASFKNETWTKKNAMQIYLGYQTRCRSTMDFLYDNENLYFFGRVVDRTIFTDKIDNDGVFLYFDLENCSDTYPQAGMFRIFLNVDGSVEFSAGNENKWVKADVAPEGINYACAVSRTYYDVEVAIPWKVMGLDSAPVDKLMRCNIEVRDRRDGEMAWERILETASNQSWTWPEFRLNRSESGIETVVGDGKPVAAASFNVSGGELQVCASRAIDSIEVYSVSGTLVAARRVGGNHVSMPLPGSGWIAMACLTYADGTVEHSKIVVR